MVSGGDGPPPGAGCGGAGRPGVRRLPLRAGVAVSLVAGPEVLVPGRLLSEAAAVRPAVRAVRRPGRLLREAAAVRPAVRAVRRPGRLLPEALPDPAAGVLRAVVHLRPAGVPQAVRRGRQG